MTQEDQAQAQSHTHLIKARTAALGRYKRAKKVSDHLEQEYRRAADKTRQAKLAYEAIDRELAMKTKRTIICQPSKKSTKKSSKKDPVQEATKLLAGLSEEQIRAILKEKGAE